MNIDLANLLWVQWLLNVRMFYHEDQVSYFSLPIRNVFLHKRFALFLGVCRSFQFREMSAERIILLHSSELDLIPFRLGRTALLEHHVWAITERIMSIT